MMTLQRLSLIIACAMLAAAHVTVAEEPSAPLVPANLSGALIKAEDATPKRLQALKSLGADTVVLPLRSSTHRAKETIQAAAASVDQAGLALAYWIEVARSPELADAHPQWMASLQTHDEWRRYFPDAPQPQSHEVVKTYPWVPILSQAPFEAQKRRIQQLLDGLPSAELVFLNDLQGAPSACGCGNTLCRWTSDYGKRRTTVPLGDDAAAKFITSVQNASPDSQIIPVWTTECEEHDGSPDGLCAGVGCFNGICWKAYTRQLMPVANICPRLAVLTPYKEFQRDIPHYGTVDASWIDFAIKTFETMPPRNNGTAIPASRMIAIVQGWNVSDEEIEAQRAVAMNAGAYGYVIAYDKIDQSWSPRIVAWANETSIHNGSR